MSTNKYNIIPEREECNTNWEVSSKCEIITGLPLHIPKKDEIMWMVDKIVMRRKLMKLWSNWKKMRHIHVDTQQGSETVIHKHSVLVQFLTNVHHKRYSYNLLILQRQPRYTTLCEYEYSWIYKGIKYAYFFYS